MHREGPRPKATARSLSETARDPAEARLASLWGHFERRGEGMDMRDPAQAKAKRHEGERIFYTTCPANGCWDAACILKCH